MKTIFFLILILISLSSFGQSIFKITKNDIAIMSIETGVGYITGWREEVIYHPNALFRHFPNLSRTFWDNRVTWKQPGKFDANHVLKGLVVSSQIVAIVIKTGDIKSYPKKKRLLKILVDIAKYYASYQLGFFLSYNVTHHNKL